MSRYTLMDYFSIYVEEWDSLLEEFLRHLAMTSFSVVLALIIAVPLGIFITRNKAYKVKCMGLRYNFCRYWKRLSPENDVPEK